MTVDKIDKGSFEPPYYQLARILEQRILSGEFKAGDSLPSEAGLCKEYELSRMTVRKGLKILASRGLVQAQPGVGTLVARPMLDRATFVLDDFHREMERRGLAAEARLLSARTLRPSEPVPCDLAVLPGERVLHFRRLLLADSQPMAVESKYMRYKVGDPVLENELQYGSFSAATSARTERLPVRSCISLSASVADEEQAALLCVPVGSPLIRIEQYLHAADETALGWGEFLYRGDRFSLVSEARPLAGRRVE